MMKTLPIRFRILAAVLAFTACTADDTAQFTDAASGHIVLTLSDAALTRSLPADLLPTDAEGCLAEDVAARFRIHLSMPDSTYTRDITTADRSIRLPLGRFLADATYGDNALIAWDAPYYTGQAEFRIHQPGEQTRVNIPCQMQNAVADFQSDDFALLDAMLAQYAVRVIATTTDAQADSLDWTPNQTAHPYIKAGARITCYLVGTLADGRSLRLPFGDEFSVEARAATRHLYTLHIASTNGSTNGLELAVQRDDNPVTITESVPATWLPAPKITALSSDRSEYHFADDQSDTMNYVETQQGDLSLVLHTTRSATAATLQTTSLGGLPDGTYDLLQLTADDLALWDAAGITLSTDDDGLERRIDLSRLVNQLESTTDGSPVESRLQLCVTANGRTTERTFVIHTEAPVFTLTLDDRHIWTRTLTLGTLDVTSGNADELRRRLRFRYQTSDASEATLTEQGALSVAWDESQSGKTCTVAAVYRGQDILSKSLTFELSTQLPNAGFEEWTDENYSGSYWCFYPWDTATKTACHWDTNNTWTTRHRWNANLFRADYNGLHAVSYVTGRDGAGLAAELRSTANGRGNTTSSRKEQNKVAGQLFTGTFTATKKGSDTNGSDKFSIAKDADFTSRPTGLSFWYQYTPFTTSTHPQDYWRATLQLLDAEGRIILQQAVSACENTDGEWKQQYIRLDVKDDTVYEKCSKIFVEFISTIYGYNLDKYAENDSAYAGNDMPYQTTTINFWTGSTIDDSHMKTSGTAYVGSILRIDDVELIYER